MPHYKDGTEAKLFDTVRGKPYNTPYEIVGVVVGMKTKPGDTTCNLSVQFTRPSIAWSAENGVSVVTVTDYGTIGEFELVYPSPLRAAGL